ncbi:MAG TPA: IS4 family transposase [Thermoanaerobaculia bacterium]
MSHQDQGSHTPSVPHHQALKQALDWLLVPAVLSNITFRNDCTWTPRSLIVTALLWAWSDEKALTDRFFSARKIVVRMFHLTQRPAATYQAFLKMLKTWTVALALTLVTAFRRRLREDLEGRFLVCGFPVFGVDGSRLELPRTESNEQHFSPAAARRRPKPRRPSKRQARARTKAARAARARQKKTNSPQMWLTTMWHVGTGLPWDWRIGPSDSSEREHLKQMIAALAEGALVTADAGFVGYEYWKALLDSGRHLLIRVGANVRLLKGLGYYVEEKDGLVYLWPDREAKRRRPPLVLRLVVARGGRHPVYLVTSVLGEEVLSDEQIIEIYALRWGIELFYRHFKQTFERRKLRSHRADHAEVEATWSLLGLWAMSLHAQVELAAQGIPARRVSVAQFLRAYRGSMREYKSCPDPGESLHERLAEAVIDDYKRASKASRDYPRKKQAHAIGAPEVRGATEVQMEIARQIKHDHAIGLTA